MSTTSVPTPTTTEVKVSPASTIITLAGKIAIVTGASRGIGRGIALSLARDGANVIVNYNKDKKAADAVVAAIKSTGATAAAIQADISSSADVDRLFAETKKLFGRIDIVVANSGIAASGPIVDVTDDQFDNVVNVNLKGTFYTLRAAAKHVENNGRIIAIGTATSVGTMPGVGPYSATKAAIQVLASTLAQELGSKGITVNTIHPGGVATDAFASIPKEIQELAANASPHKRIGTVSDIGDATALLVSESGRWISGQAIHVTGAARF